MFILIGIKIMIDHVDIAHPIPKLCAFYPTVKVKRRKFPFHAELKKIVHISPVICTNFYFKVVTTGEIFNCNKNDH